MSQGVRAIPTDEEFEQLCEKYGGNVSAIAAELGVSRRTVTRWCTDNPEFDLMLDDAREAAVDLAEDRAMMLIDGIGIKNDQGQIIAWQERPDAGLIKFILATKGKKRGYGETVALTGKDGKDLIPETPIAAILDKLSPDELEQLQKLQLTLKGL